MTRAFQQGCPASAAAQPTRASEHADRSPAGRAGRATTGVAFRRSSRASGRDLRGSPPSQSDQALLGGAGCRECGGDAAACAVRRRLLQLCSAAVVYWSDADESERGLREWLAQTPRGDKVTGQVSIRRAGSHGTGHASGWVKDRPKAARPHALAQVGEWPARRLFLCTSKFGACDGSGGPATVSVLTALGRHRQAEFWWRLAGPDVRAVRAQRIQWGWQPLRRGASNGWLQRAHSRDWLPACGEHPPVPAHQPRGLSTACAAGAKSRPRKRTWQSKGAVLGRTTQATRALACRRRRRRAWPAMSRGSQHAPAHL